MPLAAPLPPPAGEHPVVTRVLTWYGLNARDLPWRRPEATAWGVLVSEVMLQQTTVARVQPVWEDWMRRWPTPAAFAAAPVAEVLQAWGRLGYPRRALRLHAAAQQIAVTGGRVPNDEPALRALPGVGDYTAAAVVSFAYGRRAVVLDTNVRRVLARIFTAAAYPPAAPTRAERELGASLLPDDPARAARWNVAAMELGALVCQAAAPRCGLCPVAADCAWVAAGRPQATQPRRTQAWHGTDRQCRGRILEAARTGPVSRAALVGMESEPGQAERCVAGLVADGLAEQNATWVALPGQLPAET